MIKKSILIIFCFYMTMLVTFSGDTASLSVLYEEGKNLQYEGNHKKAIIIFDEMLEQVTSGELSMAEDLLFEYSILAEYEKAYSLILTGDTRGIEDLLERDETALKRSIYTTDGDVYSDNIRIAMLKVAIAYERQETQSSGYSDFGYSSALNAIYGRIISYDLESLVSTKDTIDVLEDLLEINQVYPFSYRVKEDLETLYFEALDDVRELQAQSDFIKANDVLKRLFPVADIFKDYNRGDEYTWMITYEVAYNDMKLGNFDEIERLMARDQAVLIGAGRDNSTYSTHKFSSLVKISFFKALITYGMSYDLPDDLKSMAFDARLQELYYKLSAVDYKTMSKDLSEEEAMRVILHLDRAFPHYVNLQFEIEEGYGNLGDYESMTQHVDQTYQQYGAYIKYAYNLDTYLERLSSQYDAWLESSLARGDIAGAESAYHKIKSLYVLYDVIESNQIMAMTQKLGMAYLESGDQETARKYLDILINRLFPDEASYSQAFNEGVYKRSFSKMITFDDMLKTLVAYTKLVEDQGDEKQFKLSVLALNIFYQAAPLPIYKDAVAAFDQGQFDLAIKLFEAVLIERPYHQQAKGYRVQRLTLTGEAEDALNIFEATGMNSSANTDDIELKRFLYEMQGDYKASQEMQIDTISESSWIKKLSISKKVLSTLLFIAKSLGMLLLTFAIFSLRREKPLLLSEVTSDLYKEKAFLETTMHEVNVSSELYTEIEVA